MELNLRQLKHDGLCYRHHPVQLVAQLPTGFVLLSPRETPIWDYRRIYRGENDVYQYCWFGRWFNLLEIIDPDGNLLELYAHIASPVTLGTDGVSYIDYELDVSKTDGPAQLVDEDEFAEAVGRYGYSSELQARCYAAAAEALTLVKRWRAGLPPEEALAQIDGIGE